jgi:hypothetical protein
MGVGKKLLKQTAYPVECQHIKQKIPKPVTGEQCSYRRPGPKEQNCRVPWILKQFCRKSGSADCNKSEGYVQQQQEYENSDVDKQQTGKYVTVPVSVF